MQKVPIKEQQQQQSQSPTDAKQEQPQLDSGATLAGQSTQGAQPGAGSSAQAQVAQLSAGQTPVAASAGNAGPAPPPASAAGGAAGGQQQQQANASSVAQVNSMALKYMVMAGTGEKMLGK